MSRHSGETATLPSPYAGHDVSDEALLGDLPGFTSGFAEVNGIRPGVKAMPSFCFLAGRRPGGHTTRSCPQSPTSIASSRSTSVAWVPLTSPRMAMNSGHFIAEEKPDETIQLLLEFFSSADRR